MEKKCGYVYLIKCSRTDKVYVGSCVFKSSRKSGHFGHLRRGTHHSIHLQRAYDKHGESAFSFEVVETVEDLIFLRAREQFWMWRQGGRLYNTMLKVDDCKGMKKDQKFKDAIRERMTGNTLRRGEKMPVASKQAISRSLKGNKRRAGIPHSPEIKKKISDSLKKAYTEGRHSMPDNEMCKRNLGLI